MKSLKILILLLVLYNTLTVNIIIVEDENRDHPLLLMNICKEYTGNEDHYENFYGGTDNKGNDITTSRQHFMCFGEILAGKNTANCKIQTSLNGSGFIFVNLIKQIEHNGKPYYYGLFNLEFNFQGRYGLNLLCVPNTGELSQTAKDLDGNEKFTLQLFSTKLETIKTKAAEEIEKEKEKEGGSNLKALKHEFSSIKNYIEKVSSPIIKRDYRSSLEMPGTIEERIKKEEKSSPKIVINQTEPGTNILLAKKLSSKKSFHNKEEKLLVHPLVKLTSKKSFPKTPVSNGKEDEPELVGKNGSKNVEGIKSGTEMETRSPKT
jgi:hypothetical protein